jgi:hypothetical protein
LAKKTRRRRFFRPRQSAPSEDAAQQQRRVNEAARDLLDRLTPEQVRQTLADRELTLLEADRLAQLEPSAEHLSRYRRAAAELEAAQAAVSRLEPA